VRRLSKFLRLRTPDKLLLLSCAWRLAFVRAALALAGYRRLSALLRRRLERPRLRATASQLIWAVGAAARALPGTACLAQAVTLHYLLARAGQASIIRVGVAKDQRLPFDAHAWVVCEGRVVMGGDSEALARYTALTDLQLRPL